MTQKLCKYKIKPRTAWDYVEIGPFDTFKEALDCLFEDIYGVGKVISNSCRVEYQQALRRKEHSLIEKFYIIKQ